MTGRSQRHLKVFCVSVSKITSITAVFHPQVRTMKCLFEETWDQSVVFSKARNPSGIFVRPRSSAEHPSANSHQSVSAKGNACKVYFKTQCDFTLLPSTGWGESRGGRVSHCCLFPHATSKSLSSWLISISDLYQEAQLDTGTEKDTVWLTIILTWYRFNGKVFQ